MASKRRVGGRSLLAALAASATLVATFVVAPPAFAFVPGRCFATASGALEVCHNPATQGEFYNTPSGAIAYNIDELELGPHDYATVGHFAAVKHYDPNCLKAVQKGQADWCYTGDSLMAGTSTSDNYMPANMHYVLWGQWTHPGWTNYYGPPEGVGGAANPMTVAGPPGSPYFYTFYIGTGNAQMADTTDFHWYHWLEEARTTNFQTYQILSVTPHGDEWLPEGNYPYTPHPAPILDTAGQVIRSQAAPVVPKTGANADEGLIGSISYVNGLYYYFTTDYLPGTTSPYGNSMALYVRTAKNLNSNNAWSPAKEVAGPFPISVMRVAKAYGSNRWAILYSCYNDVNVTQALCLAYSDTLNVFGSNGVAGVDFYDQIYYGYPISDNWLYIPAGDGSFGQQEFVTDRYGNLPPGDPRVTWTAFGGDGFGSPVYWADVQVYNGRQATLSQNGASAVLTGMMSDTVHAQPACAPPILASPTTVDNYPTCFDFTTSISGPLEQTGVVRIALWSTTSGFRTNYEEDDWWCYVYDAAGLLVTVVDPATLAHGPATAAISPGGTSSLTFVVVPVRTLQYSTFRLDMELNSS